jgi:hypothetical protein
MVEFLDKRKKEKQFLTKWNKAFPELNPFLIFV